MYLSEGRTDKEKIVTVTLTGLDLLTHAPLYLLKKFTAHVPSCIAPSVIAVTQNSYYKWRAFAMFQFRIQFSSFVKSAGQQQSV
jgi:hypothetical protein